MQTTKPKARYSFLSSAFTFATARKLQSTIESNALVQEYHRHHSSQSSLHMSRNFTFAPSTDRGSAEQAVFGGPITIDDYGDLIGDIANDATGTVRFNETWPSHDAVFAITIRASTSLFNTTIRINPKNFNYCDIRVFVPGAGTGYRVLRCIASKALYYGFPCIHAAGAKYDGSISGHTAWGYRAYPKYGFDADIPDAVVDSLPPELATMTRISQLVATPAGKTAWAQRGVQVNDLIFDLTPGSYSWNTLNALPP